MTKRVAAILGAIGTLFLLAAFAQKPQPTEQLTLYDGDGKRVGLVIGGSGDPYPLIGFRIDGVPLILYSFREGFYSQGQVGWESVDCIGTPFILHTSLGGTYTPGSMPAIAAGPPGNTVYVEDGPAVAVTFRSFSSGPRQPSSSAAACTVAEPFPLNTVSAAARPLVDMTTLYKPPFTVR